MIMSTAVTIEKPRSLDDPHTRFDQEAQARFLERFSQTGRHEESALHAGVSYECMRVWRKTDPDFRALFEAADRVYKEKLRAEIERRGCDGWLEPVFQGGTQVMLSVLDENGEARRDEQGCLVLRPATVRKFSDVLLLALAKRQDPEFRERLDVTATKGGGDEGPGSTASRAEVRRELERLSDDGRQSLRRVLEELAAGGAQAISGATASGSKTHAPGATGSVGEAGPVLDVEPVSSTERPG